MNTIDELKSKITAEWPDRLTSELCVRIVDYLSRLSDDELKMLTFYSMRNAAGYDDVDENLIRAVAILVNSSIHALDSKLLLIDDDEREFEIDKRELAEARRNGVFIHPESGKPVRDFESKIIPFFVATNEFKRLKAG